MTIQDDFSWYENALKGTRGPVHEGECWSGYYRSKKKDKTYSAWAYWKDTNTGEQRCQENGKNVEELRALDQFPFASKNPIPEQDYWTFLETGKWPDNDQSAHEGANGSPVNPETDLVSSIGAEVDGLLAGVASYKAIESDEEAARGQTLRSALTAISGKADKARTAEKEPHLQASRDVDARWQPLIKSAKEGADTIRTALGRWEDLKRESARKAQAETDRIAREHAEAVRKAEEANKPPPPAPLAPVASNAPAPSMQIKGGSGRTASVTVANIVTDIDLDKCFAKFRTAPELRELFMELANKSMKAGICTAEDVGAVIEQRSVVR